MKTTTDPKNWRFHFTVTDLARFLGKSPVTLRHWERQGLVVFPREPNGDRRLSCYEIRQMARIAKTLGRITEDRLNLVEATITLLEQIERQNDAEGKTPKNRSHGSTNVGQNGTSSAASISA
jgi:predicted site-specific integrase-resolvase